MKRFAGRMAVICAALQRAGASAAAEAAAEGAELARSLAPVDSGALASSIHVEETPSGASVIAGAGHAVMVEYGTGSMAAQPFMLPMAAAMRGRFIRKSCAAVQEVFR